MSNFLTIIGSAPLKKPVTPLTWTKVELGSGDGAAADAAILVTPNTTPGLYVSSSSGMSVQTDAGASGGSWRQGNANNRAVQLVVANVVGFRFWGFHPFDTPATTLDIHVDYDGNLANFDAQVVMDGPTNPAVKLHEVTGLTRGTHAYLVRQNGAGTWGIDYFEYQS